METASNLDRPKLDSPVAALFAQVHSLSAVLRRRRQTPTGSYPILAAEYSLMCFLARNGPSTLPQIARFRGISRQAVRVVVHRLAARGYVEFAANPGHKRSLLTGLSEHGRKACGEAFETATQLATFVGGKFPESEILAALQLLRKLAQSIETAGKPDFPKRRPASRRSYRRSEPIQPAILAPVVSHGDNDTRESSQLPYNLL